jgi:hypothetical protein
LDAFDDVLFDDPLSPELLLPQPAMTAAAASIAMPLNHSGLCPLPLIPSPPGVDDQLSAPVSANKCPHTSDHGLAVKPM